MVAQLIGTAADPTALFPPASVARGLGPDQRKELSIQALAGCEPVSRLSARQHVSRPFVYRQVRRAEQALDEAFAEADGDDRVLFELPVTKGWLRQWVLAQVLIGHTSYRGVGEIIEAVFGRPGPIPPVTARCFMPNATWGSWPSSWNIAPPVAPPPGRNSNARWSVPSVSARAIG